ncbi:FecCD family ABC transporter permease [Sulfuracidifex metallicus]|uniref:Iron chelate uptake ABC transporter family permease subunit n=1 Tax=Sulfuracidifex metallicus DSM 6482 = JCM 9184 TaxID=523847 RepID=A0A6A9QSX3_SULME|nr:iron ABC transporter permease [Sulfuracidifex metallicus]MUN28252.1 iron chelate uptake ABC transporter family permease subunit [Sulfuracidifex metallicus DSM 6482 = JCM 9184]WOE51218.1 iron ABC transporter permease [Sulfuracidifex metallicus DSM 6482 = JCM 9184]
MQRYQFSEVVFVLLLFILEGVSAFASLVLGAVYISPSLFEMSPYSFIIYSIRIPTTISTSMIGADLALSGLVLQMLLRNPVMDPYVSGTASGAGFGAVLSYVLLAFSFPVLLVEEISPFLAFFFSMIATLLTLAISKKGDTYSLVIGGIVISYLFSALIIVGELAISKVTPQVPSLLFFLFGEIDDVSWTDTMILINATLILSYFTYTLGRKIDVLTLSDEVSLSKGINPRRYRFLIIGLVSAVVSIDVSIGGIIGFLGVISPHIVRGIIGGRSTSSLVLPVSLLGSSILLLSNVISRGALGFSIPLTAVTSLIAVPVITSILRRGGSNAD